METTCQVTSIGRFESRIGKTLTGAVRGDEILKGEGKYFSNTEEVVIAYNTGRVEMKYSRIVRPSVKFEMIGFSINSADDAAAVF